MLPKGLRMAFSSHLNKQCFVSLLEWAKHKKGFNMAFYDKVKWVLGILVVFVLIVTTNLIDRNSFIRVNDSIATIYEDRLIANDLIFEMLKSVQEKEVAFARSDSTFFKQRNAEVNAHIPVFIERYEQTRLTPEESKIFDTLKKNLRMLETSENEFIQSGYKKDDNLAIHLSQVKENLYDLSKIQLNEGGRQMSISKRALNTVELFTQIEIYFLVFLAILIQIIVIYKPKEK